MATLHLRSLTPEDVQDLFLATNGDWTIHHAMIGLYCYTIDDAHNIIKHYATNPFVTPYVICTEENNFIGMMIIALDPFSDTPNLNSKEIEISSFISKNYRGKSLGYMAILETFAKYPGYKAWFRVDVDNEAPNRIMKALEATLVKQQYMENYYCYCIPMNPMK